MSTAPRQSDPRNAEVTAMDLLLEKNPPVIVWHLDPVRRIQVPTSIHDPHAETGGRNTDKQVCKRSHPFDEANTLHKPDGSRQCRTCKALWNQRRRAA